MTSRTEIDSRADLIANQDDCLLAIEDGHQVPAAKLAKLPPWRAVMAARIAAKAGVPLERGTLDQLVAEAVKVGGAGTLGAWWERSLAAVPLFLAAALVFPCRAGVTRKARVMPQQDGGIVDPEEHRHHPSGCGGGASSSTASAMQASLVAFCISGWIRMRRMSVMSWHSMSHRSRRGSRNRSSVSCTGHRSLRRHVRAADVGWRRTIPGRPDAVGLKVILLTRRVKGRNVGGAARLFDRAGRDGVRAPLAPALDRKEGAAHVPSCPRRARAARS